MANVLAELFQNTAAAIREKTGEAGKMKPAEFPEKIRSIEAGTAEPDLEEITITENGVYEPSESDGYSKVTVEVPPSASGKILIQADITKNGVYSPTPNLEFGYTYKFKNEYAQAELKEFYDMSMAKQTNNGVEFAVLMISSNNMVAIIAYSGFYGVATGGGIWIPQEIATAMNYAKGWNEGADLLSLTPTTTPVLTVENGYELAFEGVLKDLNPLFELPPADGYSEVSVNVPTTEQMEKTVTPDFSNGNMEITPDEGKAFSKVTISKPSNLVSSNIVAGIDIAGIIGSAAGGVERTDQFVQAEGTYVNAGNAKTAPITVTHNLGVNPDFIIVANSMKPMKQDSNNTCLIAGYSPYLAGRDRIDFVYMGNSGGLMSSFGAEGYSIFDSTNSFGFIHNANPNTFSVGGQVCQHPVGEEFVWYAMGRANKTDD